MTQWTRTIVWVAILGMLWGAALECLVISRTDNGCLVVGNPPPADTARVVEVRDSLASILAQERKRADSLQTYLDTCPADTVPRWFARNVPVAVHDTTRDTIRLPAPLARAVAESLVTCRFERDSVASDAEIWKAREEAQREALELCRARPQVVGDTSPPSRATWAAVGAAGALAGITTILLLVR